MNIETYGKGERLRIAAELSSKIDTERHLILLPVPTTRDGVYIAGTDILLFDTLSNAGRKSLIVGYGLPKAYCDEARERGASLLDLSEDEEFLSENAYITAIATLGYIMNSEKRAVSDMKFLIIGYGRIGSRLSEILLFFGAKVKICSRRSLTRIELGECGADLISLDELLRSGAENIDADIIINTAPCELNSLFPSGRVPERMRALELASGKNFLKVSGVELLPSLPERIYPTSAAKTYVLALRRCLFAGGR